MQIRRSWHGVRSPRCGRYSTALLDMSRWRMAVSLGSTRVLTSRFPDELYLQYCQNCCIFWWTLIVEIVTGTSHVHSELFRPNCCTIKWWYSKRLGHGFWSRRPTTAHTNLHVVFLLSHGCITFTESCSVQHKTHCWTPHNIIVNSTNFSSFDYQTFQSIELRCMSPGRCRELPMSRRRKGRKPPWPKPNEHIDPSTKIR